MSRSEAVAKLRFQYPYARRAEKLTKEDFDEIERFILNNADLGHLEFEWQAQRMFIGRTPRPKNWLTIMELLTAANAHVHVKPRSERSTV